jgi:hypothetical protein
MDKIRGGIIAHAASAQSDGAFTQLPGIQIGYAYVNGLALQVQAARGNTV